MYRPGIYLVGQQSLDQYAVKVGAATKDIDRRLKNYNTHTPFLEVIDILDTEQWQVSQLEAMYHKKLKELGTNVQTSKEWFYVSEEIYQQIKRKGFGLFEMKDENVYEVHLSHTGQYRTGFIHKIIMDTMSKRSDMQLTNPRIANDRINSAIYEKKTRDQELCEIADTIDERCQTGNHKPHEGSRNKRLIYGDELVKILDNPSLDISGWNREVALKFVFDDCDPIIEEESMPKIVDEPVPAAKMEFEDLRYNEDNPIKVCRSNMETLQHIIAVAQEYLDEYKEMISFK